MSRVVAAIVLLLTTSWAVAGELRIEGQPQYSDRPYWVYLPDDYQPGEERPAIFLFHGRGGNAIELARITCRSLTPYPRPGGWNQTCLHNKTEDYILIYPNGSIDNKALLDFADGYRRSWNVGGGMAVEGEEYACVSGSACELSTNDLDYFVALRDDVIRRFSIDTKRVFLVGFSNGGGFAHRLACEYPHLIAGIASIAGTSDQHLVDRYHGATCAPELPTPLLMIWGDQDPITPAGGGPSATFPNVGSYVSIEETLYGFKGGPGWIERNACNNKPASFVIPNSHPFDGVGGGRRYEFNGCKADILAYRLFGGGHTWPDGWQYMGTRYIGNTSRDISANEIILDFFKDKSR